MIFDQVIAFLKTRSAEQIAHVNGTLLAHLEGTCALLLGWGNPIDLCLAGLCHTIYGTDGFPVQLLDMAQAWPQRPTVVDNRYGDRDLPDRPKRVYVPTYYPSAAEVQAASPVELGVGAEIHGIDIRPRRLVAQVVPGTHVC